MQNQGPLERSFAMIASRFAMKKYRYEYEVNPYGVELIHPHNMGAGRLEYIFGQEEAVHHSRF